MKKNYKNTDDSKVNKVSETFISYQPQNRIVPHNSFEAAEKAEIHFIINQLPIERLENTIELILRVYNSTRESLKHRKTNNRIKFIRDK